MSFRSGLAIFAIGIAAAAVLLSQRPCRAATLPASPASAPASAPAPEPPAVLVLHSYHRGYPYTDREMQGIEAVLLAAHPILDLRVAYMDMKRAGGEAYLRRLRDLYAERYRGVRFALILTTDNDALAFAVRYRAGLFPGVPIVFCGVDDFRAEIPAGPARITGISESLDARSTLDVALRLRPQARRVVVVSDGTRTGLEQMAGVRAVAPAFATRAEFVYLSLTQLTVAQLQARLLALGEESIILALQTNVDYRGARLSVAQSGDQLLRPAGAPAFAIADTRLGYGVVGGKVASALAQGRAAGELACRILAGEDPDRIPIVEHSPNPYMFDYPELERWGIPLSALPPGSIILNRPVSFVARHRQVLIPAGFLVAGLCGVIGILARNLAERRRAEQKQRLLMSELDHRVKNNLAAVLALAERMLHDNPDPRQFVPAFIGRVRAMARTHEVLATRHWEGLDMTDVASLSLQGFAGRGEGRVACAGPPVRLPARAALPLTLTFCELATNALKYGALSTTEGRLSLSWSLAPDCRLRVRWEERGGPPVAPPTRTGLGSELIQGLIQYELGGAVQLNYRAEGLACEIELPLDGQR